jgi:hypothetical protein
MDVELPDGTVIEGVPEGTTKSQIMAKLRASGYDVSKFAPTPDAEKFRFASLETEQAGIEFIGGLAKAAEDYFAKRPMPEYVERVAGNIPQDVMAISQGFTPEALGATAQALRERPVQTLSTVGSEMLRGAGRFLRSPAETFAEAPVSTMLGLQGAQLLRAPSRFAVNALAEAATPPVRRALSPANRMIADVFGAPEIQPALEAAAPGMSIPQALADVNAPRAQAVARQAAEIVPEATYAARQAQEASRAQRMAQVAGTPEELAAAQEARTAAAKTNYAEAFRQAAPDLPEDLLTRPSMKAAFKVADDLAAERGAAATPMEALHNVKLALDQIVSEPGDYGLAGAQKAAIQGTRKEFIKELEKNAAYKKARADFAAQSAPINRMQVAQQLQKSLTAPLTGEATRAGAFATAVEEAPRTIKKATGQQFFSKLEDILGPDDMKIVNDIRDEFRRTKLADEQARLGRAAAPEVDELASARIASSMNIPFLNRAWTIANTVIKRSLGRIDEKLATEIGMMMQDPAELSKAITKAKQYEARTAEIAERAKSRRQGVVKAAPRQAISGSVSFQNVMAPENQNAMARR